MTNNYAIIDTCVDYFYNDNTGNILFDSIVTCLKTCLNSSYRLSVLLLTTLVMLFIRV